MSSALRNVLIIGLGIGGSKIIPELKDLPASHRLVVVTDLEFGYWPIGSLRSATVPGWEDKATVPLDKVFPAGSRHVVVSGTKVTKFGKGSVTLSKAAPASVGGGLELEYDYAIIASGSSYAAPMRSLETDTDIPSVETTFKKIQADVEASNSVLVVGGGATGLEFAAEVIHQYPSKEVTVVHGAPTFFNAPGYNPKLGKTLASQLESKGVKIVYNVRLDATGLKSGKLTETTPIALSNGQTVNADFVFLGTGITPNSAFMKAFDPSLVNDAGYIKVKPTLQLKTDTGALDNVFVIGDVTDVLEPKAAVSLRGHTPVVVANLLALIKNPETKSLKTHSPTKPMILVTGGPDSGAAQLFGWVLGGWFASMLKSKTLMTKEFRAAYNY